MNRRERRARRADTGTAADPRHPDLLRLAELCRRAGRPADAAAAVRELLASAPDHAAAHHLDGLLHRDAGDPVAARAAIGRAISRDGGVAAFHRDLGSVLADAHDLDAADRALSRALALDPADAEAHAEHAAVLHRRGLPVPALAAYDAALRLRPEAAAWHSNRGIVLRDLDRRDEALRAQEHASRLAPATPEILFNLGNALRDLDRAADAVAAFRRCLAHRPDFAAARCNLGTVLLAVDRLDEAATAFAAVLDPFRAPAAAAPAAVPIHDHRADAHRGLGAVAAARHRPTEALRHLDAALHLRPSDAVAHSNRGTALLELGRLPEADAAWGEALRLRPDLLDAWSNRQLGAHYGTAVPPALRLDRARAFAARFESTPVVPFPVDPFPVDPDPDSACRPNRPLRIGYLSADLCRHPVGLLLLPVLRHHDPARVHVTCYDARPRDDDVSRALRDHAARWRDLSRLSDAAATAAIRRDGVDVLVDLSGHTANNRLPVFAHRAAPVQCSWLGYWDTTGLSRMDAVLTDADTVPPGAEHGFTERVVRLPHGRFPFAPPFDAPPASPPMSPPMWPPVSPPPSARTGITTFGCFNNLSKLSPDAVSCWAAILSAVPRSRLILKWKTLADPELRADVAARFRAAGLDLDRDPDRLELRPASSHASLLSEYADLDLALDPFPFSGGHSTLDALWMGVPVLAAAPGAGPASRQTAGILRAVGVPELVADDPADYRRRAVALAADPHRLAVLRRDLRARLLASPPCDVRRFTGALEDALLDLWRDRNAYVS